MIRLVPVAVSFLRVIDDLNVFRQKWVAHYYARSAKAVQVGSQMSVWNSTQVASLRVAVSISRQALRAFVSRYCIRFPRTPGGIFSSSRQLLLHLLSLFKVLFGSTLIALLAAGMKR